MRGIVNNFICVYHIHSVYLYQQKQTTMKAKYRIQNENGTFLNAGTGLESWFTLEDARKIVSEGQIIVEHDGVNVLWEIL